MEKIAFLNDPAIIASIVSGIFMLISGIMALYIYRSKKKFKAKFDRELESHKSWLDRKNKEIQSQLDTKLELLRIEYGTVFTKRLEVIEDIYDRLLQIQELYTMLSSHDKNKEMNEESKKRLREALDNYNQFLYHFERKKLYLSEELVGVIMCFILSVNFRLYEKYPNELKGNLSALSEKELSVFNEGLNVFENISPKEILNALENEFRTLIGVEVASKNIR